MTSTPDPALSVESNAPLPASMTLAFPSEQPTKMKPRCSSSARPREPPHPFGHRPTLARALLWEPRVLLLDEATAAIDGASDEAFRSALRTGALARGCAILSVAHRLSTARDADRVAVIENGRIVEIGPPSLLIRRGGLFAAWVEIETAGWHWEMPSSGADGRAIAQRSVQ